MSVASGFKARTKYSPTLNIFTIAFLAAVNGFAFAENPGATSQPFQFGLDLARSDFDVPALMDRPDPFDMQAGPELTVDTIMAYQLDPQAGDSKPVTDAGFKAIIDRSMSEKGGKYTFGTLQQLANELTNYLRQNDNLLATVYLPSQRVNDGKVRFDVLMGTLGAVKVQGNEYYKDKYVQQAFEGSLGENVNRANIEESMLLLQEYPGLTAGGTFYPGQSLGETQLVINVNQEDRLDVTFLGDNYGTDSTGKKRAGMAIELLNPFQILDKLTVNLVLVEKPDQVDADDPLEDRLFGSVRYELNPWSTRWGFGFEANANNYQVGDVEDNLFAALEVTGETQGARMFITNKFLRSRSTKIDFEGGLRVSRSETSARGVQATEDKLTVADLRMRLEHNDEFLGGGVNFANLRFAQGIDDFLGSMGSGRENRTFDSSRQVEVKPVAGVQRGGRRNISGDFMKLEYNLLRYQPMKYANILVSASGQYSTDPLPTVQQSGMGGPYNLRAYPTASFLADQTEFYSVEVIKPLFDNKVQLSAFYDYGEGKRHRAFTNERDRVTLSGIGLGVRWNPLKGLNLNLTTAWALGDKRDIDIDGEADLATGVRRFGRDSEGRDEPMVYFSVLYGI